MGVFNNLFGSRPDKNESSPPLHQEQKFIVDEKKPSPIAIIHRSEFDVISRYILDYPDIETGGELYGFWSNNGIPVVLFAIGPGPNANHEGTFFNQDIEYMVKVGNFVRNKFGMQHIGSWHSHHKLGLAHPSGHDAQTAVHSMQNHSMRRLLMCIGNCDDTSTTLNAYMFHENSMYDYVHAAWSIKEMESPYRPIIESDLSSLLINPKIPQACHKEIYSIQGLSRTAKIPFSNNYWLNEKRNHIVLKQIMDYLKNINIDSCVSMGIDKNHEAHIKITSSKMQEDIWFADSFPIVAPKVSVTYSDNNEVYKKDDVLSNSEGMSIWKFDGDIYQSFVSCYNQIRKS